eukprot:223719-Pleurochrysis_carterae.AAC.2
MHATRDLHPERSDKTHSRCWPRSRRAPSRAPSRSPPRASSRAAPIRVLSLARSSAQTLARSLARPPARAPSRALAAKPHGKNTKKEKHAAEKRGHALPCKHLAQNVHGFHSFCPIFTKPPCTQCRLIETEGRPPRLLDAAEAEVVVRSQVEAALSGASHAQRRAVAKADALAHAQLQRR